MCAKLRLGMRNAKRNIINVGFIPSRSNNSFILPLGPMDNEN